VGRAGDGVVLGVRGHELAATAPRAPLPLVVREGAAL
jgi:hypothetical protein